jgi:hypothetical protein
MQKEETAKKLDHAIEVTLKEPALYPLNGRAIDSILGLLEKPKA